MKSVSNKGRTRAALASTAIAGLVLTALPTNAQVVFDDGMMHTISDASYAAERIEVRNSSKLKIVDGAVISALLGPNSEFSIQVFDSSMLIIQGGSFGGDGDFSGSLAAFDQSRVIIENGTFGTDGNLRSGMIAINDDADLSISGGTFTSANGSGGRIELYGDAHGRISGGFYGAQTHAADNSTLAISGGAFGKDNPGGGPLFFRGAVFAKGASTVKISGGSFGVGAGFVILSGALLAQDAAHVIISGGTFSGNPAFGNGVVLVQAPAASAKISGGVFDGTEIHVVAGLARIEGCAFNLPFGPVAASSAALQGILANGDVIEVTLTRDSSDAIIDLVEECDL